MEKLFVTGIDTGVGKTLVAAILAEALEADYWKPVQAGNLEHTDSMEVQRLLSNPKSLIHPETYRFKTPVSPHDAAEKEKKRIELARLLPPVTANHLIIEGAGGLMVPLNDRSLVIDLIVRLNAPVVLVSKNYLGSINHTLLSIEALKGRGLLVAGIVFNGKIYPEGENFILRNSGLVKLGHLYEEKEITPERVKEYALSLKPVIKDFRGFS